MRNKDYGKEYQGEAETGIAMAVAAVVLVVAAVGLFMLLLPWAIGG